MSIDTNDPLLLNGKQRRVSYPTEIVDSPASFLKSLEDDLYSLQFADLLQKIQSSFSRHIKRADPVTFLKLKCIQAEVYDYFGRFDDAKTVLMLVGPKAEASLRAANFSGDNDRVKAHIWTALHWSYTFYRRDQLSNSLRVLALCRHAVSHLPSNTAYLTRAKISYAFGLVYREQHEYEDAKRFFLESMELARRACEANSDQGRVTIADYTVAKCLALGLAWIYYTEGRLTLSKPLLIAAQALLAGKAGTLIEQYVFVIECCVQRASASNDPAVLKSVIRHLKTAYTVFEHANHHTYKSKAADQLALAYLHEASFLKSNGKSFNVSLQKAETYAKEVESFATLAEFTNFRSQISALIVKSRIRRLQQDLTGAMSEAEKAVSLTRDRDKFNRIDAFIARGECFHAKKEFRQAILDFTEALRNGEGNPKIIAICHLHLAEIFLDQEKMRDAEENHTIALNALASVDHAFVRMRAKQVQERIDRTREDLFLSFNDARIDPDAMENRLHGFLARWARSHSADDVSAAKLLGKSKATLYSWLKNEKKI